jgi:hypothetical protein
LRYIVSGNIEVAWEDMGSHGGVFVSWVRSIIAFELEFCIARGWEGWAGGLWL